MLKQASISQIRSGDLTRRSGYLVATMCYYPRGLRKRHLDEYRGDLAPDRALFREWKTVERRFGHEKAFRQTHYEERFSPNAAALEKLRELARLARKRDVYLICQCLPGERCHREMLLLLARDCFGARIAPLHHAYPRFRRRMKSLVRQAHSQISKVRGTWSENRELG